MSERERLSAGEIAALRYRHDDTPESPCGAGRFCETCRLLTALEAVHPEPVGLDVDAEIARLAPFFADYEDARSGLDRADYDGEKREAMRHWVRVTAALRAALAAPSEPPAADTMASAPSEVGQTTRRESHPEPVGLDVERLARAIMARLDIAPVRTGTFRMVDSLVYADAIATEYAVTSGGRPAQPGPTGATVNETPPVAVPAPAALAAPSEVKETP